MAVHKVIRKLQADGKTADLLIAARLARPGNVKLIQFAQDLGLTPAGPRLDNPTGKPFEEIIRENAKFINLATILRKLPVLEGQVC